LYRPKESLAGLLITLSGLIFYYLSSRMKGNSSVTAVTENKI